MKMAQQCLKKVFSETQIENRLIFTTMTATNHFLPNEKLKCKGQRSSLKLDRDLLDKSVTLAIFKSERELLPKRNVHALLRTGTICRSSTVLLSENF